MVISETARAKARDFIDNEKQFQLGFLPTEQSNPITATLEEDFQRSTLAGVQCLQRGDRQIPITMRHVFAGRRFAKLVDSIVETVTGPKGRVVFSGCGATGRLSIAWCFPAAARRGVFRFSLNPCGGTFSTGARRNFLRRRRLLPTASRPS